MSRLEQLKAEVLAANRELIGSGLVTHTWGNVSAVDRESEIVVIKPSGVPYGELTVDSLAVLSLTGKRLEGDLAPSSDAPTHLVLYQRFPEVGAIVHTHSRWATVWAQAERPIPVLGTTHADYFGGEIPCTRPLTEAEIDGAYEHETGAVIAETFAKLDPSRVPAVLVSRHGPFAWGATTAAAVENAQVLEEVAETALHTMLLDPNVKPMAQALLDRHFLRKRGPGAYYGQPDGVTPHTPAG